MTNGLLDEGKSEAPKLSFWALQQSRSRFVAGFILHFFAVVLCFFVILIFLSESIL